VHVSYIAKYILKVEEKEALEILSKYIKTGEIIESPLSKGYFQTNDKNVS
jgi:hypothetical protein